MVQLSGGGSLKCMATVVRDDGYDRFLTPLTFAWFLNEQAVKADRCQYF